MAQAFNPHPSARELAISEILQDVFGPDSRVPEETPMHYDVDASLLNMMLNANPSEEHLLDYFSVHKPGADSVRIRAASLRLLDLISMENDELHVL